MGVVLRLRKQQLFAFSGSLTNMDALPYQFLMESLVYMASSIAALSTDTEITVSSKNSTVTI